MTHETLLTAIMKTTYTKSDFNRRLRLLREYLEQDFFMGEKVDMTKFLLSKRAISDDIDAFITWGEPFYKVFTRENAYATLTGIAELARRLPVVTLYIPYEPVPAEVNKLGRWFRTNVGDAVILDIHTDPTLLGGCAFAHQGIYRDYSLRYFMQKRREEIAKVIETYVAHFYQN